MSCFSDRPAPTNSIYSEIDYLKFNNSFCAIDYQKKQILFPLPEKYYQSADFNAIINYSIPEKNTLFINSILISSGAAFTFQNVSINDTIKLTIENNENSGKEYSLIFTGIPIVQIFSSQKMDDIKLPATFTLTSPNSDENIQTGQIGIEKRGSSTLRLEKNSFSFEFWRRNNWNITEDREILEMREDDDWILDASYWDRSFMRNRVSHDLFLDMWKIPFDNDGKSTIAGKYVELFLDNEYFGIYILSERIDRKLLQLSKQKSILFKAVSDQVEDQEKYRIKYPDEIERGGRQRAWDDLDELNTFIEFNNSESFQFEIKELVDIENVVNYQLLLFVTSALDNSARNYYLARNGEGKFFFAPWDMDATFGRFAFSSKRHHFKWIENFGGSILLTALMEEDFYKEMLKTRYFELRQNLFQKDALINRFEEYFSQLYNSGAYQRNMDRWPITDEYFDDDDYADDYIYIRSWISRRINKLDDLMNNL